MEGQGRKRGEQRWTGSRGDEEAALQEKQGNMSEMGGGKVCCITDLGAVLHQPAHYSATVRELVHSSESLKRCQRGEGGRARNGEQGGGVRGEKDTEAKQSKEMGRWGGGHTISGGGKCV